MTKKTISYFNNNLEDIDSCQLHAHLELSNILSTEDVDNYTNLLLNELAENKNFRNISRAENNDLIYIPIIFGIVSSPLSSTLFSEFYEDFPEYIDLTLEELQTIAKNNAYTIVEKINNTFAGTGNVAVNHKVLADNEDTDLVTRNYPYKWNYLNLPDSYSTNIRFFLPYKLPKELLHPFNPFKVSTNSTITDYNSVKNNYISGVTISESYNSQYTYDDIKAKRELVKSIADGSRSRNTNFEIGDEYEGGYIFQINEDGTGLVADLQDLGEMSFRETVDAVEIYTVGGYNDWRLPSLDELELMYNTLGNGSLEGNIGGFSNNAYWSSLPNLYGNVFVIDFTNGSIPPNGYFGGYPFKSRVIRQVILPSSNPPEVTTLAEMEDDYFFYFGDSPGVIFFPLIPVDGFIGMGGTGGGSYQIRNIVHNQGGYIPLSTNSTDNSVYGVFSGGNNKEIPFRNIFQNIPAVQVFSNTGNLFSGGLAGWASAGSAISTKSSQSNVLSFSMSSMGVNVTSGENLGDYLASTTLHEFGHTLGYLHSFDGYNLSGFVSFYKVEKWKERFKQTNNSYLYNYNRFYVGFKPPFKYYDINDESQFLEDESTLPDFEIIDPNEKLFAETAIKKVQELWQNMDKSLIPYPNNNFNDYVLPEDYIIEISAGTNYTFTSTDRGKTFIQYSKLFGLISHLPTFWGGSYITNTAEEQSLYGYNEVSLVINPSTSYTPSIGDVVEGGIIYKVNEDLSYSVLLNKQIGSGTHNELIDIILSLDEEGYSDWNLITDYNDIELIFNVLENNNNFYVNTKYVTSIPCVGSNHKSFHARAFFSTTTEFCTAPSTTVHGIAVRHIPAPENNQSIPNISVRNAICDKDDNTIFNKRAFFTLEWYDNSFPAFPDNTRVEDMFSPDLCPCLYEDQTVNYKPNGNKDSEDETVTFKFFTPQIDNVTGENVTNRTGVPMANKEVSKKLYWHYNITEDYMPLNNVRNIMSLFFNNGTNETTRFFDYIGDPSEDTPAEQIRWTKTIGGVVLPNFPVYTGFVPEGPLPAAFKFNVNLSEDNTTEFTEEDILKIFSTVSNLNDPSIYNTFGINFRSVIDKYFRIGSTDPNSNLYNPFKIDVVSGDGSFISSYLNNMYGDGDGLERWENYYDVQLDMRHISNASSNFPVFRDKYAQTLDNAWYRLNLNFICNDFFTRTDNIEFPLLDRMGNTLYGPINTSLTSDVMYYDHYLRSYTNANSPSANFYNRLEFFTNTATKGFFQLLKKFTIDLYSPENNSQYSDYLPDTNQQTKNNTLQLYINEVFEYLDANRVEEDEIVIGCTDPSAFNYNASATTDSGTCIAKVFGCTNLNATNYNSSANTDDGSCIEGVYDVTPVQIIRVCPSSTSVPACNNESSESRLLFLPSIDYENFTDINLYNDYIKAVIRFDSAFGYNLSTFGAVNDSLVAESFLIIEAMLNDYTHSEWQSPFYLNFLDIYRRDANIITSNECTNGFQEGYSLSANPYDYMSGYTVSGPNINTGGGCIKVADPAVCSFPEIYNNTCTSYAVASTDVNNLLPENSQEVSLQEYINFYNNVSSDPTLSVGVCNNSNTI
tara:strand:+ start:1550 stop:6274 length:4725 start_codon:yes stop_codon:yes gene_type:complete